MSTGANFAGLKFSSHSDYRMLSRRKRLLESFKEITKLFSIFLSQLSPFFRLTQFFSPSILPSFNKSRNNRVAFLQRHQGLIIPRKVSEKCDETAEALFFIISFILFRVNRFHRRSCYSPSPREFFYWRWSVSLSTAFSIAIRYWSFKITVGKEGRGGWGETLV